MLAFKKSRARDFRAAVLKSPPWFLAVLIVLGGGLILTQFVFFTTIHVRPGACYLRLSDDWEGGGGDRDPGGEEDDTQRADENFKPRQDLLGEEPQFESLEWIRDIPSKKIVGTLGGGRPVPAPLPKAAPVAVVRERTGGGAGTGRGRGRGTEGSPWANRSGEGRARGVKQNGGSAASESAVEMGLDWLARHQSPDGRWDGDGYHRLCRGESCGKNILALDCDTGLTGLALMCFLGTGYTHKKGPYRRTVLKGLEYFLAVQDGEGRFHDRRNLRSLYNQSLAIIAISEAYGLTQDPALREPLRKGLGFLLGAQQQGGGWTYTASGTERNDMSITGFAVMAIRAAREAGIDRGAWALSRVRGMLDRMTVSNGEVVYADTGTRAGDRGAGMIAVGLFTSFLLGRDPDHPMARRQLALLRAYPPSWNGSPADGSFSRRPKKRYRSISNSMYYWYYATLGMFCAGGEDWGWWNSRIRDMLVVHQRKSGCAKGSWDPVAIWAEDMGRIYSTALNVLSLEIYYRYVPGFLLNPETGPWEPRSKKKGEPSTPPPDEQDRLSRLRDLVKSSKD